MPPQKPTVDPNRQAMIGMFLIMLVLLVWCQLKMKTAVPPPQNDNAPATDGPDNAPDRPGEQAPAPQTQPGEVGDGVPETAPQSQAAREGFAAFGGYEDDRVEQLYGDRDPTASEDERDAFNTQTFRPTFSTRGAALHSLELIGYFGETGPDHRQHYSEDTLLVRPFDPDRLSLSVDLPGLAGEGRLASVNWEYLGHEVTPAGGGGETYDTHRVRFQFPPADVESPVRLVKTFAYDDRPDHFDITQWLTIDNQSAQPLALNDTRVYGPVGLFSGYFAGRFATEQVQTKVDPRGGRVYITSSIEESEAVKTPERIEAELGELYRAFEQAKNEDLPTDTWQQVRLPEESTSEVIDWTGQFLQYFEAVAFAPAAEVPEGGLIDTETLVAPPVKTAEHRVFQMRNPQADQRREDRLLTATSLVLRPFTVPAGESRTLCLRTYLGPREKHALEQAGLGDTMKYSYDWVTFLAKPLLWLLGLFESLIGNWGIAIILLTLVVRLILAPVSLWSQYSMQLSAAKMKKVQPKMKKLQEKFKGDPQRLRREMAKLYQKEGFNPAGMMKGCLLMLLQMPIWIALFGAFRYYIEFLGANFLWIHDLSKPDALFTISSDFGLPLVSGFMAPSGVLHFNILPFFVAILMGYQFYRQSKLQPATDPQQKQTQTCMAVMMPLMMFVLFYGMAAGFNLYFMASSLYGLIETKFVKHRISAAVEAKTGGATN